MIQRSPEWFAARVSRVTGSNVGAILGCDPYRGPKDVMRAMVRAYHGSESEFKGNIATEWGVANESNAQFEYTVETGNEVEECGFFTYQDWLGASPDGLVLGGVLEIKCPFGKRHQNPVVFKTIEEQPHYYAQMQIEMLCTGTDSCDFFQWTPHAVKLETVQLSNYWLEINLPKLKAFHELYLLEVNNKDHLEDVRKVIDGPDAMMLLCEYNELLDAIARTEARRKEVLEELIELSGEKSSIICGRKLTKVERKGSVKYAEIVKTELPHLDLELHRGKPSTSWKLT